ncbi:MAG: ABC transporter permease [Candidatus Woesearchaeota archaeon]
MKILSVIKKNIKLLLRNRISNFVLIFSPLIIIFLIGISFSTNSFNVKLSVFSKQYSTLSNSLIDTLIESNYFITRQESEQDCINSVSNSFSQACLIFPENLKISNDKTEKIKVYVDQSKLNIAYLVLSTLEEALGQKTTDLSKEMTDKLIEAILLTKNKINSLEKSTQLIDEYKDNINFLANKSSNDILLLDFSQAETSEINTELLKSKINQLFTDSLSLITDSQSKLNSLDNWVMPNGTSYINSIETNLNDLNTKITEGETNLNTEIDAFNEKINLAINDFKTKLENTKKTNQEVYQNLLKIIESLNQIKSNNQLIKNDLKDISDSINKIEIINSESIIKPIETEINPVVKQTTNLGFLFPSLLALLIMFIGIFLTSTLVIMEKNSKAFFRVFTTPNKNRLFVFSTYLTSFFIIIIQIFLIFMITKYYFKIDFSFNSFNSIFIFLLSFFIIITFFIFLGLLIGNIFNSEEISMLASLSIVSILLFTSGAIFPLESMPSYILEKAKYNPMYISTEIIKKLTLLNSNLYLTEYLKILSIYSFVIAIIILFIKKYEILKYYIKKLINKKNKK